LFALAECVARQRIPEGVRENGFRFPGSGKIRGQGGLLGLSVRISAPELRATNKPTNQQTNKPINE
jgi:hypothetical protein